MSLQRALLGEVHPLLRQASIEADSTLKVVRIKFEYAQGDALETAVECCRRASSEVAADFPSPWQLDEQHVRTSNSGLAPLMLIAYKRYEPNSN